MLGARPSKVKIKFNRPSGSVIQVRQLDSVPWRTGVNGPACCYYASAEQLGSHLDFDPQGCHLYDTSRVTGTQLWNRSGGIWLSNNWVGTPPANMEQLLGGRNLVVHCDQGFTRL